MSFSIDPSTGLITPGGFVAAGGALFFSANDGTHGLELWKTDGTTAGTTLVKDINPGGGSSYPSYFVNVNGTLFFTAGDAVDGLQLWKSDGTPGGTVMISGANGVPSLNLGFPAQTIYDLTAVGNTLFFIATDGRHDFQLWKSDGTATGTARVTDANGVPSLDITSMTAMSGTLYFAAYDPVNNSDELWKSDGTAAGTTMLTNGPGHIRDLTAVNGQLFFVGDTTVHGYNTPQLWVSDGTASGTRQINLQQLVNNYAFNLDPRYLTDVNGTLFFSGHDYNVWPSGDRALWKSDGTDGGTVQVAEVDQKTGGYRGFFDMYGLANINGTLFFLDNAGNVGVQLWESDGTSDGTLVVHGFPGEEPSSPVSVGGKAFFSVNRDELWESDGTAGGTALLQSFDPANYPYGYGPGLGALTDAGGTLYFSTVGKIWKLVVDPVTTTTLISSPSTCIAGQSITFTATVNTEAKFAGVPTGTVAFLDGTTMLGTGTLNTSGVATFTTSTLTAGAHSITADYQGDDTFSVSSSSPLSQIVNPLSTTNLQAALSDPQQGGAVMLQTTSSDTISTAVQAVNGLSSPATPETVTLDLAGATTSPTAAFAAPSGVQVDLTSSSGNATAQGATVTSGTVVVAASVAPTNWTVNGGSVIVQGSASAKNFTVNGGTVTLADGTVITGGSSPDPPALIVHGGQVILQGVTATTATPSPTILITGGTLTVRQSTIQESTGSAEAAILITGGSVDLGTASSPGGNTFNVNGTGTLIENTSGNPVPAAGNTFENNGTAIASNFGNVSLTAPSPQTASQGVPQPLNFALTDTPGDSQSWNVDVNWGDGTPDAVFNTAAAGPLRTPSHSFALPGTYTVTVTATDPITRHVAAWDLVQTFTVSVAPSIFVLNTTASGALTLSDSASINIPGAVVVDSKSASAVSASGNAQLKAAVIDVTGGVQQSGNAIASPTPVTGVSLPDPFAGLSSPITMGLSNHGAVKLSGGTLTIPQGIYSQINVSGKASLTLMTGGTYIIEGGGLTVSGSASITGQNVFIYNAGSNYPAAGAISAASP
jgi:ELWxxDGT repeat protein